MIELTFAIGDIHGHLDKLLRLLARCDDYRGARAARLVFLGDYIDRGPDSRAVVGTLRRLEAERPGHVVCLKGNHEEIIVDIADGDDEMLAPWLEKGGGAATLHDYGVTHPAELGADDLQWMRARPLFHDDGRRFFVHAGVDPDVALDEQTADDLLWIREPFLSSGIDFGRLIVHGHTPTLSRSPELRPNRLNLDTAAGYDGPLTAAVFGDATSAPIGFIDSR